MTRRYRFSRKADVGLTKIWRDVAVDNPQAADELYYRMIGKIEHAANHPGMGSPRSEIGKDVRMLVEGNYNIYYVQASDGIVITAIVHSKRLPSNWS